MQHRDDTTGAASAASQAGDDMSSHMAGPEESFPLNGREDLDDAWAAAAHTADPDRARDRIITVAFNKGWEDALPADARAWMNNRDSNALGGPGRRSQADRVIDPEVEALQPDDASSAARHRGMGLGTGTPL